MDENKKRDYTESTEKEIVFSKMVKAGKRIYYLDVKKNRKNDMYLAITESKKVVSSSGDDSLISFEKHKIFLYNEDLDKFNAAMREVIAYMKGESIGSLEDPNEENENDSSFSPTTKVDIDIDF